MKLATGSAILSLLVISCASTPPQPATKISLLYVQTASSGSLEPLGGSAGKYRLLLDEVSPRVVLFSDRPNRIAGQVSTTEFLDKIGFGGSIDPNAAIEVAEGSPDSDLIIAALSKPAYDAQSRTLSYEITILETPRKALAVYSDRMDKKLPAHFGAVALFIDDAPCPAACGTPLHTGCHEGGNDWPADKPCPPASVVQCCPGMHCLATFIQSGRGRPTGFQTCQ